MEFIKGLRQKNLEKTVKKNKGEQEIAEEGKEKKKSEERVMENIENQRREAKEHMDKSDFPRMADELISLVPGMKRSETAGIRIINGKSVTEIGGVSFQLDWGHKKESGQGSVQGRDIRYSSIYKFFEVKFYPDGRAVVKGGWFGSTILKLNEWTNNPKAVDSALGKAFHRPQTGFLEIKPK